METKDPTDKLRGYLLCKPGDGGKNGNVCYSYESADALADEIEAAYMKLPVDADGVPIKPGDRLVYGSVTVVTALVTDGYICTANGTKVPSHMCRHVKPDTVENILEEFAQEMNENMGEYVGEVIDADEWRRIDEKIIAKYAERIRKAVEHEKL